MGLSYTHGPHRKCQREDKKETVFGMSTYITPTTKCQLQDKKETVLRLRDKRKGGFHGGGPGIESAELEPVLGIKGQGWREGGGKGKGGREG